MPSPRDKHLLAFEHSSVTSPHTLYMFFILCLLYFIKNYITLYVFSNLLYFPILNISPKKVHILIKRGIQWLHKPKCSDFSLS